MKAKITMTFSPDGGVQTEVNGVKGKSCAGLTSFLEKDFGPGDRTLQAEYYQQETVQVRQDGGVQ